MEQEEFMLFTSVERALGYKNKNNKYMLVAAALADEEGKVFLV